MFFQLAFTIISLELSSIHYSYSGTVSTIEGQDVVTNSYYPYPYYSDEWVGVSLTEYSIHNNALPLVNPLDSNKHFANPLMVFYSVVAELFLVFGMNPLTGWAVFALINGLITSILVYKISRALGINAFAASIAMLSVPLITNATNAPGIWFFVPFLGSLSIFLLAILLTLKKELWFALIAYTLSLMLYPPMVVFILPTILGIILLNKNNRNKILSAGIGVIILGAGFISIFLISNYGWIKATQLLTSWVIRHNLDGGIPYLAIWNIVPIPLLALACIGIIISFKKKLYQILFPVCVGLVMWVVYAYVPKTFIVDYSRIVSITAILLMPLIGLGSQIIIKYVSKLHSYIKICLNIAIVVCVCIVTLTYPSQNSWSKLTLAFQTSNGIEIIHPSNPINRYIDPTDLSLFANIHEKYFLSPSWKGLVIGVATHNYPLESKSSTIANQIMSYNDFVSGNCFTKNDMASGSQMTYVFAQPFNCPNFLKIGDSPENLSLYQYISK